MSGNDAYKNEGANCQFFAKSEPPQTIYMHTGKLRQMLQQLHRFYGKRMARMDARMWGLLKIAVDYHDVGKAESCFQYKIQCQLKDKLGLVPKNPVHNESVPHNYLSVGLIPFKDLKITKEDARLLAHVVGYHHERDKPPDLALIREILEKDIRTNIEKLAAHTGLIFPQNSFSYRMIEVLNKRFWPPFEGLGLKELYADPFWDYVMLKGLLHRLDHTASDPNLETAIEADVNEHIGKYVSNYFRKKGYIKNDLQIFAEDNKDKNIIAIAQTGMGKTEAALYWIGQDKAYFTLPLRVSANAIYNRIFASEKISYSPVGLLHSTSVDYLISQEENWEQIINQSRHLADKLTITTIDQILKFPFFYRGFEKELATLAYSKVVIDEIQAYDPNIVAMLIKALEMIYLMGGKFMIMTATMPSIYLQKFEERGYIPQETIAKGQFIDDDRLRHKIKLQDQPICEATNKIVAKGLEKQVLVIVNTVNQGIQLYELIDKLIQEENLKIPLHLLHSRFILKDRQQLEDLLLNFNGTKPKRPGVWITTQIVEASLDIDFDYLFTELSTLDSLFQRLGRCYRKRVLTNRKANVEIYTEEVSGVPGVYDRHLINEGLLLLQPYHSRFLTETDKLKLVENLYSYERLKGTKFLEKLESSLEWFDNLEPYNLSKQEAQKKMRNIQQSMLLPASLWSEIEPLIESYKRADYFRERYLLKRQIEQFTVNVWRTRLQGLPCEPLNIKGLDHIYYADVRYDFCSQNCKGKGLILDNVNSGNWIL